MKVLICGGRDFTDWNYLNGCLKNLHSFDPFTEIIHGGARGADQLAHRWAIENQIPCHVYYAEWDKYGRAAGPIRNQQMLDDGKPDVVVAFPGGKGTQNMITLASKAGITVVDLEDTGEP